MMIMLRNKKIKESISHISAQFTQRLRLDIGRGRRKRGSRTEDELLRGRKHVERERDLVLVALALKPAQQLSRIEHGRED